MDTEGTDSRNSFVRDVYIKSASTEGAGTENTYTRDTYTRDIIAKNTISAGGACIKGTGISDIYGLAHKPSKSPIGYSRLLTKLTFEMSISFCLYLQLILNKVLDCYSIYLIYSIVHSSFQSALMAFNIVVL